uniref:Protein broad-minded n=1 Tax=Petromyzon marinus TaxID=7757 RepID=S4RUF3_PETMA
MEHAAESDEDMVSSLRELLWGLDARTGMRTTDALLRLEETDDNFHKYEFVKQLKAQLERSLGRVIDDEIERSSVGTGVGLSSEQETLVQRVAQRVTNSDAYAELEQSLKVRILAAVDVLLGGMEEEKHSRRPGQSDSVRRSSNSESFSFDNSSDSDSSFNGAFMFMNQEQFYRIAENLDSRQPLEVRRDALHALYSLPPSDVLASESWSSLRKGLMDALGDADPTLSDKSLRLHAKMFTASSPHVTKEIYTSLAEHLENEFHSQMSSLGSLIGGLDVTNANTEHLLKKIRLLNDFQKEVPSFWIRSPEKLMEEIVESTLSFLACSSDRPQREDTTHNIVHPICLLSLLDPKAAWFKLWMHGYYSRTVVLRLLETKYISLIKDAVQQCYSYSYIFHTFAANKIAQIDKLCSVRTESGRRTTYTRAELLYLHFVHSLCMLGRLLMYAHGRKLFPLIISNRKEPVSLSDVMVLCVQLMCMHGGAPRDEQSDGVCGVYRQADVYDPGTLALGVLRMLCDGKESATECLYNDAVVHALTLPISACLEGRMSGANKESTLLHVADIMARVASTDRGLSLLLWGEGKLSAQAGSSPAHVIVEFCKHTLDGPLVTPAGPVQLPWAVIGAFVFVCRQLYNTAEGLQVLQPYRLHDCLAHAWREASSAVERAPTPSVCEFQVPCVGQTKEARLAWEETLLDNLLNFAATPRGLLLLQQTGAIGQCVAYMFSRYTSKLQVSKCEKFGYGVMVTQVSATAPGIAAVNNSGYTRTLVTELWAVLECGRDDVRVLAPRPTALDPIDRSCHKFFLGLVNLLSSYHAVRELLGGKMLPNKEDYSLREIPTSIVDIVDRLILVNSKAKIHSLFNYEQSHTFGLRLLSVLCCGLDTLLLLESQYHVSQALLACQVENTLDSGLFYRCREFIIDGLSLERNHVLVQMYTVGGPSERLLPPHTLLQNEDPYPWPLFFSYPVPQVYMPETKPSPCSKQYNTVACLLLKFKEGNGVHKDWLASCQRLLCNALAVKSYNLSTSVVVDVVERVVCAMEGDVTEQAFKLPEYTVNDANVKTHSLSDVQQLGMKMVVRYGRHLKLLKPKHSSVENLSFLLKHSKAFLQLQQKKLDPSSCSLQGARQDHDWFVSSVFLMTGGDRERSWQLLRRLSGLLVSALLWPARLHASVHLAEQTALSGVHPLYSCTCHWVESILKSELPLIFSAFRMSGYTPSQICQHWLSQCFWNYLDWAEVCAYVGVCVALGPDYQLYTCLAVLRHLEPRILQHTQSQDLQIFLREEPIHGFRLGEHLSYMKSLEKTYRDTVLSEMKNISSS